MSKALPNPAAKAASLARQKSDMTAEGAPPPGKVVKPAAASPFTGPLGHKRPPWGKKR